MIEHNNHVLDGQSTPDAQTGKDVESSDSSINQRSQRKIAFLSVLVFPTVFAAAILHVNQYEFIFLRFPGLSLLDVSYFDTVLYSAYLIVGILIGALSDRFSKRKIFIVIGSAGSAIAYWLMTVATDFGLLLVFRFVQGAFTVMSWQILLTLVLDLSVPEYRGRNMGIFGIFLALAMGLGPMMGGIIAGIGVFMPYYTSTFLNIVVFVLSIGLLVEPKNLLSSPSLSESISLAQRKPELIIPGIFNFVDRLHMGFVLFILQMFIPIVLGLGPDSRGIILGIYALPFILLQYPVGKMSDKHGRFKPLIVGSIGFGTGLCFVGILGSIDFGVLAIMFIILGIFSGLTASPAMALVGDIVKPSDNAAAMGYFNFMGNLGIALGPIIGGILLDYTGFVITFIIVGSIEIISLALILTISKILSK
jgi:MFS family permease